jgi:DNA-binding transcriptional MerR regulator
MQGFTIGQLANQVGVAISTLRYYERIGLVKPNGRTEGNYRHYDQRALARLRFIRSAQATGFSIEDIRELLSLTDSEEPPCEEVATLTRKRLGEIRTRIKQLREVEKVLAKSMSDCCTGQEPALCEEITRLQSPDGAAKRCKTAGKCRPAKKSIAAA